MGTTIGTILFILAPGILGALLIRRFPRYRRVRWRRVARYLLIMSLLIWLTLEVVANLAESRVRLNEVVIILWFAIGWRLAYELWGQYLSLWGRRWVRWGRRRKVQGMSRPLPVRLIPVGRSLVSLFVFLPLFVACLFTCRPKIVDGRDPMTVYNMTFEPIRIDTNDGHRLDAWFIPQPNADRTIIVCHGAGANKGNFLGFLGPLSHHGYNVVFFDFRGHGASTGRITTYGIRERNDVLAVVEWLKRERPGQSLKIVGLGSSLGSMALALAAAEDPRIDAVILDSAFTDPHELAQHHADRLYGPIWSVMVDLVMAEMSALTWTNYFDVSAERAVSRLGDRPLLVIHGEKDLGMPPEHSRRLYDAATGPRDIWLGPGGHSSIVTHAPDEYERRVFSFLDEHLSDP